MRTYFSVAFWAAALAVLFTGGAVAQPVDWQLDFQPAATERMREIAGFHDFLLVIITAITLFVLALLIWVMIRYNSRSHPVASKTTHNTFIEIVWTVVPVLILAAIAIPSFRLLYYTDVVPPADLTIKVTGNQWNWTYAYPDHGDFEFVSARLEDNQLQPGDLRLLAVDNRLIVPVGKTVRVIVTASDVIHAFTVPAFGFKIDAVPGRINQTWFNVEREGVYYGQCSELCGAYHAFMPIVVEVVSQERFDAWAASQQAAMGGTNSTEFAAAETASPAP